MADRLAMSELSFASLWQQTLEAVRADRGLLAPLAGTFLLLPSLVLAVAEQAAPELAEPRTLAATAANLVYAVVASVGQLAILIVVLDRIFIGSRPVSDAVAGAFRLLPRQLGIAVLSGLATLVGLILLILPGLYVAGRLALASPLLVAGDHGVLASLRGSWEMTRGHAWRVLGYLLVWFGIILGAGIVAGAVAGAAGAVLTVIGAKALGLLVGQLVVASAIAAAAVYLQAAVAVLFFRISGANPAGAA